MRSKKLTPRHERILKALTNNSAGIYSFELRQIAGAMNIADEVMQLRRLGYNILCRPMPYITQDGKKTFIGRYKLARMEAA